jgi:hypothetical protein
VVIWRLFCGIRGVGTTDSGARAADKAIDRFQSREHAWFAAAGGTHPEGVLVPRTAYAYDVESLPTAVIGQAVLVHCQSDIHWP